MNAPSPLIQPDTTNSTSALQLSKPVPFTSPIHLRAVAHLYGVETTRLENARVLELGCETGGNLLPFALAYPDAQVVGVDLWPENIQHGQQIAQDLNIKNLALHNKLFTEIDQDFGTFDYIIVHDQFTWAPSFLREAILRICRENLSPLGIAYISYNTYPGWKAGDTLRDAMQLHNHSASTMEEVLAGAAAMLNPMSDGLASHNPQAASLKAAVEKISQHPDYYINSEFLQATTASFYFIEFAEAAAQAGLAYVGDAEAQGEMSVTHGQNVQLNHSLVTLGQPKLMKQQYLDFAIGREFRKSLFVRQERAASVLNTPDLNRFADLNWATSLQQSGFSDAIGKPAKFLNQSGQAFTITDETEIRICNVLVSTWPASISYEHLAASTQDAEAWLQPEKAQRAVEDMQRALETLFKLGALHYSLGAGPYDHAQNHTLQAFIDLENFAQPNKAEGTIISSFNLWHAQLTLHLKPAQAKLLKAIDGTRSTQQLLALAGQKWELEPTDKTADPSTKCNDNEKNQQADEFAKLMNTLRTQGALLGSDTAWFDYFQTMLGTELLPSISRLQYLTPYLHYSESETSIRVKTPIKTGVNSLPTSHHKSEAIKAFNRIQELRRKQRYSEAEPVARNLTIDYPRNATSWHILGIILMEMAETEQSVSSLFKALSLQPENTAIYADLSAALQLLNEKRCAEVLLRRALKIDPQHVPSWLNFGNLLRSQNKTSLAESCYRNALATDPKSPNALNNLSTVFGDQGRLAEAIDCLRKVVTMQPDNYTAHSNLLFTLSQYADIEPTELFKEHRAFGRLLEKSVKKQTLTLSHTNLRDPQKVLRLGFVSGDLCNHAVANFLESIWKSFNKQKFELYAYSNTPMEDEVTQRLKTHVKSWEKVVQLSDQALAQQINTDEIDILFDLSGHTAHNRLPMFALKPAPVLISWIGYPGTTGLKAMNYYLVDKYFAPHDLLDDQFTEKLVRLPCVVAFQSSADAPAVNPLPVLNTGNITFGSFNRLSKITDKVLSAWAQILNSVPDSRLLIGHLHGSAMFENIKLRFAKLGINADRLILRERTSMQEYLRQHHHVDLLLDTFPYTGGTTTNHGLWMGVPTLTVTGRTLASYQGASLMRQAGLKKFIASNQAEYVNMAIDWSTKSDTLAELRNTMRNRLKDSLLYSPDRVTLGLEIALRKMWHIWCNDKPAEKF